MKKFSNQVKINESIDNTFLLGKNVKKLPDFFTDIKDLIETYKEYYDFIESISISYGYTSKENIKITKNPASKKGFPPLYLDLISDTIDLSLFLTFVEGLEKFSNSFIYFILNNIKFVFQILPHQPHTPYQGLS